MNPSDFDNTAKKNDITFCYRLLFGRHPNKEDQLAYTTAIRSGWSVDILTRSFLSSLEFKNRRYPDILASRESEWNSEINEGFSQQATEDDVKYCYRFLLGRNPDKSGLHAYKILIKKGCSIGFLLKLFLSSKEFNIRGLSKTLEPAKPELINMKEGFKLYVYSNDDVIGGYIRKEKEFEPHVTKIIKSELFRGATFLDIGANMGYYSILAAKIVGKNGKVYSFEPYQPNINLIFLNSRLNKVDNIFLYPFALADKRAAFVVYTVDTNAGLLEYSGGLEDFSSRDIVYSATLDELLAGVDQIDIIKIDVEGFEYKALSGGINLLKKHNPIIFSEFLPTSLKMASQITAEKYLKFLIENNYSISIISESGNKINCEKDIKKIMKYFYSQTGDHIDFVAYPI